MDTLSRVTIVVAGKVQGVSFRANTKKFADDHKITGFAQNMDDGTVTIVGEGLEPQIERLVEFCTSGPPGAIVYDSNSIFSKVTGEFSSFDVR